MTHALALRSGAALVSLVCIAGLLVGCGAPPAKDASKHGAKDPKAAQTTEPSAETDAGGDEDDESDASAAGAEADKKLGFTSIARLPYEEVAIPTDQPGGTLYGRLYDPFQKPESDADASDAAASGDGEEDAGPKVRYPLVILLHPLNGGYKDWGELPALLVSRGYAALTLDLRGHGKSVWRNVSWRQFAASDWAKYPQDALRAARYFDASEDYPQVDSRRVAIIGASIGANAAVLGASGDNARVRAVVTLSAGLDYKGLKTTQAMYAFKNAILMIASQDDPQAFDDTNMLYRLASGHKELLLFRNIGHGTDMLRFYPQLMKPIADWLVRELPPTPQAIPPAPDDGAEEE
ncbi:MAG: alpha/beta fold hydrolase [Vampirovibrionales bacterium]|nr:alpha/beta fold hydrolase [Vampirovibrionales bacterium]